ncbi:hypothetical protein [uncultured Methanobrevibacter sp.]|uniref:hypothetical protein n=1 Tax=uncultured Methanobrevibacter sp. TaxID=253161 RepID=UPI0026394833|nr:hypothetical protein [uncultured Methanobrevibacter sp.]
MIGGDIIILEWYATWVNLAFPVCIFLLDYSMKELIRGLDEDFEHYGWEGYGFRLMFFFIPVKTLA